jgi:hypothetical protein
MVRIRIITAAITVITAMAVTLRTMIITTLAVTPETMVITTIAVTSVTTISLIALRSTWILEQIPFSSGKKAVILNHGDGWDFGSIAKEAAGRCAIDKGKLASNFYPWILQ